MENERTRCSLCHTLVENEGPNSSEHRTACFWQNRETLRTMRLETVECKNCPQCDELLVKWPGEGEEFACFNNKNFNRCHAETEGRVLVNQSINWNPGNDDINGKLGTSKFSCFLCDIHFCGDCVEATGNQNQQVYSVNQEKAFILTSSGAAKTEHPLLMGVYKLSGKVRNHFPVYKQEGGSGLAYVDNLGNWVVSPTDSATYSLLYSIQRPTTPYPPTTQWNYFDGTNYQGNWNGTDSTLQMLPTNSGAQEYPEPNTATQGFRLDNLPLCTEYPESSTGNGYPVSSRGTQGSGLDDLPYCTDYPHPAPSTGTGLDDLPYCTDYQVPSRPSRLDDEPSAPTRLDDLPYSTVYEVPSSPSGLDDLPYCTDYPHPAPSTGTGLDDLPYFDPSTEITNDDTENIPWVPSAPPDDTKSEYQNINPPPSYEEAIANY